MKNAKVKAKALAEIAEDIRLCRVCRKDKIGVAVPGEGDPDADILFLGEAPGKEEAKTGRPFIGRSGKLLRSLIHDAACKFEHHLHKGIDENVCTLLGHPKFCPHGRTIPEGRCCREAIKVVSPAVSPLSSLKPGNKGHVAYLHTTDPKRAQMLISMGVIPGASICLLASFPSLLFQLGEGQFAVDAELARAIYIRLG